MNAFRVDFDRLILLLLPTMLRKPLIVAFLRAAIAPLHTIYVNLSRKRDDTLFLLKYDTGKRNVEIALRLRFNDEGIYIENSVKNEGLYLDFYLDACLQEPGHITVFKTAYLDQYLNFYLDEQQMTDDFTIYVPELTYITSARAIYDFASFFVLPGFKYSVRQIN